MTTQCKFSQCFAQLRPITNGHELAEAKSFAKNSGDILSTVFAESMSPAEMIP